MTFNIFNLDTMTLIFRVDLNIVKMYLHNQIKYIANRQTDRQT